MNEVSLESMKSGNATFKSSELPLPKERFSTFNKNN